MRWEMPQGEKQRKNRSEAGTGTGVWNFHDSGALEQEDTLTISIAAIRYDKHATLL